LAVGSLTTARTWENFYG